MFCLCVIDIARKLIERSTVANLNIADRNGRTPLMYACQYTSKDLVEYLISKGSKLNVTDSCGESPLLLSVVNGSVEMMEYLLNIGVNVSKVRSYIKNRMKYVKNSNVTKRTKS